ncbi:acyl-CoA thioesterase [Flavihumibacter sp. CACIAM 22H1]|uniref:acyl-CoA thioesterase n=1 Tax=Flavihumibacter sp. CACIAM 22H1 TaxID=1812911 RepID=UPI0007A9035C|nr:acyl-CoA thioesterase [Flavihumibacter sp. CACIAM 22H1]KYP16069.1 MAG: thioesterase [Flavihumibacter sp. CACIAM 22H1]
MARIKLAMPPDFHFETAIPVRITDLNYGGHVGNDTILSMLHEARIQFLRKAGYTELNMEGVGLIMSDAAIEFRQELFYGDTVLVKLAATEFSRVGFELYYQLEKQGPDKPVLVALAKTAMVCYNYTAKKVAALPVRAKEELTRQPL